MHKIYKNTSDIALSNELHNFCIYDRGSVDNVLFVGSCRHSTSMFYYSLLNPDINIYSIYIPFWQQNTGPVPLDKINTILKSTKLVITETIRNCNVFNTDRNLTTNFFQTFDCRGIPELRVPNLHLEIFLYDIINICKRNRSEYRQSFVKSITRLKESTYNKGFGQLYEFIIKHFSEIRMFYTINHPSTIVSMLLFKIMMDRLGETGAADANFFYALKDYHILAGHCTPITVTDMTTYNFKFDVAVFDDSIVDDNNFIHIMPANERIINNKYLDIISS